MFSNVRAPNTHTLSKFFVSFSSYPAHPRFTIHRFTLHRRRKGFATSSFTTHLRPSPFPVTPLLHHHFTFAYYSPHLHCLCAHRRRSPASYLRTPSPLNLVVSVLIVASHPRRLCSHRHRAVTIVVSTLIIVVSALTIVEKK
ncbi:hypothetical protein S83_035238 [Arachis hypogaea]|nr:uncharacterized protein LOC112720686 [Arachis hypogaea]